MSVAPAPVIGQLNDVKYINWLKAAKALQCTVQGLRPFCQGEMNTLHQSLVNANGNTTCSVPCPSANIVFDNRRCNWSIACPNNVCSQWLAGIVALRVWNRFKLTFDNSSIDEWPIEPWQVAKVFMAHGQQPTSVFSTDTDAAGLLQLLTNCKHFRSTLRNKADAVSVYFPSENVIIAV